MAKTFVEVWESVGGLLAELDALAGYADLAANAPTPYVRPQVRACLTLVACMWGCATAAPARCSFFCPCLTHWRSCSCTCAATAAAQKCFARLLAGLLPPLLCWLQCPAPDPPVPSHHPSTPHTLHAVQSSKTCLPRVFSASPQMLAASEGVLALEGCRHPCVEAQDGVEFIRNDCELVGGEG